MSSQRFTGLDKGSALKKRVLAAISAGPACLVATAVVSAPMTVEAAPTNEYLAAKPTVGDQAASAPIVNTVGGESAAKQWWHNGWVRPWNNWNNWHNWPNWHNWHNWSRW